MSTKASEFATQVFLWIQNLSAKIGKKNTSEKLYARKEK
jgi:hypothetical protein